MRKLGRLMVLLFAMLIAGTGAAFALDSPKAPPPKVVKIVNGCLEFCFKPAALHVAPGTSVTWKNTSISIHTVTRCVKSVSACPVNGGTGKDKGPNSPGTVSPGKSYTFKFQQKGTYVYYCKIHGYAVMHGTITVG